MKNKAPLSLMEQFVMLLVFALSAVLCLQIYVLSGQISRRCEVRGEAVTMVQNTAEAVKYCKGDPSLYARILGGCADAGQWHIGYDENWEEVPPEQACYHILIHRQPTELPTLARATVSARTQTNDELFCVTVSWQEVGHE